MDLKDLLEVNKTVLNQVLENPNQWVREIRIPKKSGGFRKIVEPVGEYKEILKSISDWLSKSYKVHNAAHGFRRGRSIVTNAAEHLNSFSVGTIDIKNFFDNVTERDLILALTGNTRICRGCPNYVCEGQTRCKPSLYNSTEDKVEFVCPEVRKLVEPDFEYEGLLDTIIKLCTYKGSTPQGFPTSPVLANIAMRGFDKRMTEWCEEKGIRYTRYADDLAFSQGTRFEGMPGHELANVVVPKAKALLWGFGFRINDKKIRFKHQGARLELCGVVVNDKLSISKYQVKMFRAMVHHACVKHPDRTSRARIEELKGWCSYYMSVNYEGAEKYMSMLKGAKPAF